jgi:hypothetical protein
MDYGGTILIPRSPHGETDSHSGVKLLELKSNLENTKLNSSKSSEESIVVGRPT